MVQQFKSSSSTELSTESKSPQSKLWLLLVVMPVSFLSGYWVRYSLLNQLSIGQFIPKEQSQTSALTDNSQWQEALAIAQEAAELSQDAIHKSDWETVTEKWESAIAILETLFPNEEVEAKLIEYQTNLNYALNNSLNPPNFRNGINLALQAAENAQTAVSFQDWEEVVKDWESAIALLAAVPNLNDNYAIAQAKVAEYQDYLNYAQQQRDTLKPDPTETSPQWQNALDSALAAAIAAQSATSPQDWQNVAQQWQAAVTNLKDVPPTDPQYDLVASKLAEYRVGYDYALQNAENPPYFRNGVNAATLAQTARSKQQ